LDQDQFAISAITIEEIFTGLGHTFGKQGKERYIKAKNESNKILMLYEIFQITKKILERAGFIRGQALAKGDIIGQADAIIIATGEKFKVSKIITRNPEHFRASKIPIESYNLSS